MAELMCLKLVGPLETDIWKQTPLWPVSAPMAGTPDGGANSLQVRPLQK